MPTTFYLQSGGAGYVGYNIARLTRGAASTTATVDTVNSGTDIQWTLTSGGTPLSFCSRPLSGAVTISGTVTVNVWAEESNNTANAGFRLKLFKLSPNGTKTLFATLDKGTELPTSPAAQNYTGTPTSTAFSVGDRIVMEPYITNIGSMNGSRTCTMSYNGPTAGVAGDAYVTFTETVPVSAKTMTI